MIAEKESILDQLRRKISKDEYARVRHLWIAHSKAEDARDIPGLMATLTPDCVYELPQYGLRWEGHAGATRFYNELLTAFPDIQFDLRNIVIGPQGVWEEADVIGTHQGKWLEYEPTGLRVSFHVQILFPWDTERQLFSGERVWYDFPLR